MAFAGLCFLIALGSSGSMFDGRELTPIWPIDPRAWIDWALQLHWIVGFLVITPFLMSAIIVLDLHAARRGRRFRLVAREPSTTGIPSPHADEDRALWQKRRDAVEGSWEYEKDRILRLQCRLVLQALIFGAVTTFALMCSVLVLQYGLVGGHSAILPLACSVAGAAATAFLANLGRIMLRISGGDLTARTFSWAIRSVVLVIIADLGLYVLLDKEMSGITHGLLLGIFVGATGDHAIQFLLAKAAKAFNTGAGDVQKASPLLDIEGMTATHVDRLEEEGIVSIHDLAFVPTARLFFATAYSMQQICNWQDRALLLVYVGKKSADALAEQMNIRGAIDLRAFAHDILFGGGRSDVTRLQESLGKALHLEQGGLEAVLESMAHDEVTMRIRYYWGSVIAPAQQTAIAPTPPGPPTLPPPDPAAIVPQTPLSAIPRNPLPALNGQASQPPSDGSNGAR